MQIGRTVIPDRTPDPNLDTSVPTNGPGFDQLIVAAQREAERRRTLAEANGAGLDQFSDQGWLAAVKAHGASIGLGRQAQAIVKDGRGEFSVADPALRARIIALRSNPNVRAVLAVKRMSDTRIGLTAVLGRAPTDSELRIGVAIGAKSATQLFAARQSAPLSSAAILLPDAAAANRGVFFRPDGTPHTVSEVMTALMQTPDPPAPSADPRLQMRQTMQPTRPTASARPQLPPDIGMINSTLGMVSMPGKATGIAAPNGAKISGWRADMTSRLTQEITQPNSTVRNLPSNVTVPAPGTAQATMLPARVQTVAPMARPPVAVQTAAVPVAAQPAASPVPAPAQLQAPAAQPSTAPSAATPLAGLVWSDMQPLAFAASSIEAPSSVRPATTGSSLPPGLTSLAPLPSSPTDHAVTAPIARQVPLVLAPQSTAPQTEPPVSPAIAAEAYVRPSRYGPGAQRVAQLPSAETTDASSAGIRPSRLYASSFFVPQRPMSIVPAVAPVQPAAQAAPAPASPVATVVGPDGLPILPPVSAPPGLGPISATEALAGTPQPAASIDPNRPLDLSPTRNQTVANVPTREVIQPFPRQRPRVTPAF
ncbi:MAG: hypothetical protein P4L82_19605 [Ancalomicrobiaceae bacterium]|nr:hypothetical protein [Ancalomicrobiaceae bacterium]